MDVDFYNLLIKFDKSAVNPLTILSLLKSCFGYEYEPLASNHIIATYVYKYFWITGYRNLMKKMKKHISSSQKSLIKNYISNADHDKLYCSSSHHKLMWKSDLNTQHQFWSKVIQNNISYNNITLLPDYVRKIKPHECKDKLLISIFWKNLIIKQKSIKYVSKAVYNIKINHDYSVMFNVRSPEQGFDGGTFRVNIQDDDNIMKQYQTFVDRDLHHIILFKHGDNPATHTLLELNHIKPIYKLRDVEAVIVDLKNKTTMIKKFSFPRDYVKFQDWVVKIV